MTWFQVLSIGTFGERMDLRIRQGASFGPMRFEMVNPDDTPVDLSNCEIRSQIRRDALDSEVILDIPCTLTNPMLGIFEIALSDEQTRLIQAGLSLDDPETQYIWDMELEDGTGRVIPLYYGRVFVLREVTRS